MKAVLVTAVSVFVLAAAACGGGPPNRMSVPQKVDVGTSAWCQAKQTQGLRSGMTEAQEQAVGSWVDLPQSSHQGMGLPIEGTRLEVDILAVRATGQTGIDSFTPAFQAAMGHVVSDCQYILNHH